MSAVARTVLLGAVLILSSCAGQIPSSPHDRSASMARWALVAEEIPSRDDTSFVAKVWEVACSSGREIADKLLPPEVSYEGDRIVVRLWLEPLPPLGPNEAFGCVLRAPTRFVIRLDEPIGDRTLEDAHDEGDLPGADLVPPGLLGDWVLMRAVVDGTETQPAPEWDVRLGLNGADLQGYGGCNNFHAPAVARGHDRIEIGRITSRLRGCPDGRGDFEGIFLRALPRIESFEVTGDVLRLRGAGVELEFRR